MSLNNKGDEDFQPSLIKRLQPEPMAQAAGGPFVNKMIAQRDAALNEVAALKDEAGNAAQERDALVAQLASLRTRLAELQSWRDVLLGPIDRTQTMIAKLEKWIVELKEQGGRGQNYIYITEREANELIALLDQLLRYKSSYVNGEPDNGQTDGR